MSIPTTRRRRPTTAAKAAAALGVSVRTVYRYVSEPRDEYESRAQQRKETAGKLWKAGKSWGEIASAVGGSEWSARALVRRYRADAPNGAGRASGPAGLEG